jgi:hypothetical protein
LLRIALFAASGLPPDLPPPSRAYPGFCASAELAGPALRTGRISPAKVDPEAAAVRLLHFVPCRTRRVLTNLKALAVSVRADLVGNAGLLQIALAVQALQGQTRSCRFKSA